MANNNYSITVTVSESFGSFNTTMAANIDNMKEVHRIDGAIASAEKLLHMLLIADAKVYRQREEITKDDLDL